MQVQSVLQLVISDRLKLLNRSASVQDGERVLLGATAVTSML